MSARLLGTEVRNTGRCRPSRRSQRAHFSDCPLNSVQTTVPARDANPPVPSNHERVQTALELLTAGMADYAEDKLRAVYKDNWIDSVSGSFRDDRNRLSSDGLRVQWDAHALLTVMWDQWNAVFRSSLGHTERSLVSELREFRNRWAHQKEFDFDDTYRILDSVRRLLQAAELEEAGRDSSTRSGTCSKPTWRKRSTRRSSSRCTSGIGRWVIAFYTFCFAVTAYTLIAKWDGSEPSRYFFVSTLLLAFIYLIYRQYKLEPPILFGPHECRRCRKIIYRKDCPYCEA